MSPVDPMEEEKRRIRGEDTGAECIAGDLSRRERRQLKPHETRGANGAEARRALAVLRLAEGWTVSEVARLVEAARSSVCRWVGAISVMEFRGSS